MKSLSSSLGSQFILKAFTFMHTHAVADIEWPQLSKDSKSQILRKNSQIFNNSLFFSLIFKKLLIKMSPIKQENLKRKDTTKLGCEKG